MPSRRRSKHRSRSAVEAVGRGVAGIGVAILVLLAWATPAAAHSGDSDRPTNYETIITSTPDVPGLDVHTVDAGRAIRLENQTEDEVIVLGFADEPYLRIGPDGTFQNRRSPATYLNSSYLASDGVPSIADPAAEPEWERISDDPVATWHDHRAHWMGAVDPEPVQEDPGTRRVVQDGEIPLLIGGDPAAIGVEVAWVPPPSPWPWVAAGGVVLVTLVLLTARDGSHRGARFGAPVLVALILAEITSTLVYSTVAPPRWWLAGLVLALAAAIAALSMLTKRTRVAYWLLGGAGVIVASLVGLPDHLWLNRSQLPTELDPFAARMILVGLVAIGSGLALMAVLHAARPERPLPPPTSDEGQRDVIDA